MHSIVSKLKCVLDLFFWDEKLKAGNLTEKKVNELIEEFIKNRNPPPTTNVKQHNPLCMCVICIKRKVEGSRESMIKELLTEKQPTNRDPRTKKEGKTSK